MTSQTDEDAGDPGAAMDDAAIDAAAARLYLLLGRMARLLRREGGGDLGPGSFSALATVARDGPMRLGELAAREAVAPPTLSRIVAALEDAGLITREPDPLDRRAVRVDATPSGQAVVAAAGSARAAVLRGRIRDLAPGHRQAVLAALPALETLVDDTPSDTP